jgi:hypothetical protein
MTIGGTLLTWQAPTPTLPRKRGRECEGLAAGYDTLQPLSRIAGEGADPGLGPGEAGEGAAVRTDRR